MPISGALYKRIGRAAAGAVAIVAVQGRDGGGPIKGLTVSSFVTLSFEPPLVMFAIQQSADSYSAIMASQRFGVSLLGSAQSAIARAFATKGPNKGASIEFVHGKTLTVPLIPTAIAHVECLTSQTTLSGDHAIVIGTVEAADFSDADPLLYFAGQFGTFRALQPSS